MKSLRHKQFDKESLPGKWLSQAVRWWFVFLATLPPSTSKCRVCMQEVQPAFMDGMRLVPALPGTVGFFTDQWRFQVSVALEKRRVR